MVELGLHPVMLAPMEDVTDPSFRLICREMGASLVYTEFVSGRSTDSQHQFYNSQTSNNPQPNVR